MTHVIGLTGSIGTGKSTTANMFRARGVPVWDADAAVHALYSKGGGAVDAIGQIAPDAIKMGAVDRDILKAKIREQPAFLEKLEQIVHPLVQASRQHFIENADAPIVLLDIPLLFEAGADTLADTTICVSISPEIQQERVLERGTMTLEIFDDIRSRQMPDAEKRERADITIETTSLEAVEAQVDSILKQIKEGLDHA